MSITIGALIAGKYRVEGELGKGGMGAVYAAQHVMTQKKVAIKLMLPTIEGFKEAAARFAREAQAAGQIHHPNVVDVYDIGDHDGAPYIVMEMLVGKSLADIVRGRKLLPHEALSILIPAMRGIAAAHDAGVVHRDLKPENIFVCGSSEGWQAVKVLDFGISKVLEGDGPNEGSLTRTGAVMGTPHYMAPEQIKAARDSEPRTDVYALGVMLYRMLTGDLPFRGESYGALAIAIATDSPAPMRAFLRDVDPELEAVIFRAMARNVWDRYPNVAAFARALEPWAKGLTYDTTGAHLPASIKPNVRSARPNPNPTEDIGISASLQYNKTEHSDVGLNESSRFGTVSERRSGTSKDRFESDHSEAATSYGGVGVGKSRAATTKAERRAAAFDTNGTLDPQISRNAIAGSQSNSRIRVLSMSAAAVVLVALGVGASALTFSGSSQDSAHAASRSGASQPVQVPLPVNETGRTAGATTPHLAARELDPRAQNLHDARELDPRAQNLHDARELDPRAQNLDDAGVTTEQVGASVDDTAIGQAQRRRGARLPQTGATAENIGSSQNTNQNSANSGAPVVESTRGSAQTTRRAGNLSVEDF